MIPYALRSPKFSLNTWFGYAKYCTWSFSSNNTKYRTKGKGREGEVLNTSIEGKGMGKEKGKGEGEWHIASFGLVLFLKGFHNTSYGRSILPSRYDIVCFPFSSF